MAAKPKKNALKDQDRRHNRIVQIGLTAIVVVIAVVLVLYIVISAHNKPAAGATMSIRVTSSKLITKESSTEPKAVLSVYEDFLCPACGSFERNFGPTINKLIDSGAVAADYYTVAILDKQGDGYSSRASNAAYCVAGESTEAFRRFHAVLYAQQPAERVGPFPANDQLIETARETRVAGSVPDCINSGRYTEMAKGLATATGVKATPTIRINGQDYNPTTPDAMVAKIKEIVGDVPGVEAAPPAPPAS